MPSDSDFALSDRLPAVASAGLRRIRAIELEALKTGGRLRVALRYAPQLHTAARMQALLDAISNAPAARQSRRQVPLASEGV